MSMSIIILLAMFIYKSNFSLISVIPFNGAFGLTSFTFTEVGRLPNRPTIAQSCCLDLTFSINTRTNRICIIIGHSNGYLNIFDLIWAFSPNINHPNQESHLECSCIYHRSLTGDGLVSLAPSYSKSTAFNSVCNFFKRSELSKLVLIGADDGSVHLARVPLLTKPDEHQTTNINPHWLATSRQHWSSVLKVGTVLVRPGKDKDVGEWNVLSLGADHRLILWQVMNRLKYDLIASKCMFVGGLGDPQSMSICAFYELGSVFVMICGSGVKLVRIACSS